MADSILSAFPLPPTHIRPTSPMLRPGLLMAHNPPPTQPPSGPLPPLPPFPSPISQRDSLMFLSQPKRGSRRLSSTGSIIGSSRPTSEHRPPSDHFRSTMTLEEDLDAILNAVPRSTTPSSRSLKTAKSLGSALATAAGSGLGSRTSTKSRSSRRKGQDNERSSSPDIGEIIKSTSKPRNPRSSSTPGRGSRRKSTMSSGSLGLAGPSSSRDHGSQDSFRSYSPLLPDHTGFLSSPPTSDSEHSDSSIDLHTPLPHLMVRDGLLSPYSKILVNQAALPTPTDPESRAKFLKAKRDARDTEERRTRHRDGKLLRDGVGLTTGLGWSDSEDEGAPSALTRRLSSLDMSSVSRRTSTFSLHSTRSYSSLSSHAQRQRAKLSPSSFSSAPPSAFPRHIPEGAEPATSYFSPMSPDFPPSPFSLPIKRSNPPELRSKPISLPPLLTSLPAVTTNVIEATPRLDPPPAGRSLAPKSPLNLQPLLLSEALASGIKPPLSPGAPPQRVLSGKYGSIPPSPRQSSLPTPLTSPVPAVPSVIPQGRRTPSSSLARLSVASSSSAGSERMRTVSTASSTGSSVLLTTSTNNNSSSIKRTRALSNASSIVSTSSSRGPDTTAASMERRQRTLSTASSKSNGSASKVPVPALPTSRPPSTTGMRQPSIGTGMQYRSASRAGTASTPKARASVGSVVPRRPSGNDGTPVPATRLSAPSSYGLAKRPSIASMGTANHAPLQAMAI